MTKNSISSTDYKDVVENCKTKYHRMNIFKSILHEMYTQLKNKVDLCPKDDKRYIIPDNAFRTLAWRHKDIDILKNKDNQDVSKKK